MEYSLETLEFDKVKEILAGYLSSPLGEVPLKDLAPVTDFDRVNRWFSEVKEAIEFVEVEDELPLADVEDLRDILESARLEGAVLSADKLLRVKRFLVLVAVLRRALSGEKYPTLSRLVQRFSPLDELKSSIGRVIDDSAEVRDTASSELEAVRGQIRGVKRAISERLRRIIHNPRFSRILQDRNVHIRDGRYVVAVRADRVRDIRGMVVDTSSTGYTAFVEPDGIIELNNRLAMLAKREKKEVEKILRSLTSLVGKHHRALMDNQRLAGYLDFVFAKAKYARDFKASIPRITKKRVVTIVEGRHPVLYRVKGDETVPLTLDLGRDFTTLIITGPNTGGKTVALKTVGLLSLMAASGIPVTAGPDSEFYLFEKVLADIGDEQSIEQNLSTFSSHIKRIAYMLERADSKSLILIDELGAGTDPEEGSALAVAIAEAFHEKGSLNVITTHHGELKVLAYKTEGMENASVEFDLEALSPTYRLLVGVPGKSNAFVIAEKLGLSPRVIEKAKSLKGTGEEEAHFWIQKLKTEAEERLKEAQEAKEAAKALLDEARKEAESIKEQAYAEAERLIEEALSLKKERSPGVRVKTARKVRGRIESLKEKEVKEAGIDVGDRVSVSGFNVEGTVVGIRGRTVEVDTGRMKIEVPFSALKLIEKGKGEGEVSGSKKSINVFIKRERSSFFPELHIRGYRVDDAIPEVERFINDGYLLGIRNLKIIHGKGEGILKNAVHDYLRDHPLVKRYRLADEREGSSGVTLVELDL